ncbi:MAG: hypothetical protein CSA20_05915 [Deltaproteobacteria bacterium]|nr:MAG: hypothetical protein CSA20_05915 [Deltaproteobacteria bacterium]
MKRIAYIVLVLILGVAAEAFASAGISGDGEINLCDEKTYTITVTNETGNTIHDVVITNNIPAQGFEVASVGSITIAQLNGQPFPCRIPADPAGPYDLEELCYGNDFLYDTEPLTIVYKLKTDCDALSGTNEVKVDYTMNGDPFSEESQIGITVNPGALTITKSPASQPAAIGEEVTTTITVENTGLGAVKNVKVTDILGDGLELVSVDPNGTDNCPSALTQNGQTLEWAINGSMASGAACSFTVKARLMDCQNLYDKATVSFGCDNEVCYDTAVEGPEALSSVQMVVKTPNLKFTPPELNIPYCPTEPIRVEVPITNEGDGPATNVVFSVDDFSPFTVEMPQGSPDSYSDGEFTLGAPIPVGAETYKLVFNLVREDKCDRTMPSSPIIWEIKYKDPCGEVFIPPLKLQTVTAPAAEELPVISLEKDGPDIVEYLSGGSDTEITYTITSHYSGPTNCNGQDMGDITVIDTLPEQFPHDAALIEVSGGGTYDSTAHTIEWTYSPGENFSETVTLTLPKNDCEGFCGKILENTVRAEAKDCCGCDIEVPEAEARSAITCDIPDFQSENKKVEPASAGRCLDPLTYTNSYEFPATSVSNLGTLKLVEHASDALTDPASFPRSYVDGSLEVFVDGAAPQNCTPSASQNGTGDLTVEFGGCDIALAGKTLVVKYKMINAQNPDTPLGCEEAGTFSWTSLVLDSANPGPVCSGSNDTVLIEAIPPQMTLEMTGFGERISDCDEKDITIKIDRIDHTPAVNPYDVWFELDGAHYSLSDFTCSGIAPENCVVPLENGKYLWKFDDKFVETNETSAIIKLKATKLCGTEKSDLEGTLYFHDKCNDKADGAQGNTSADLNTDNFCSITTTAGPIVETSPDLMISKTPEVYQTKDGVVEWVIYITNKGDGAAHNVWIEDILPEIMTIESSSDIEIGGDQDGINITEVKNQQNEIVGFRIFVPELLEGEKREIKVKAKLLECSAVPMINTVEASWGCSPEPPATPDDSRCQKVESSSELKVVKPQLQYTGTIKDALWPCSKYPASAIIKNVGLVSAKNVELQAVLPPHLSYKEGSAKCTLPDNSVVDCNPEITTESVPDPNDPNQMIDQETLNWKPSPPLPASLIAALEVFEAADKIDIAFEVITDCNWKKGELKFSGKYQNLCLEKFDLPDNIFKLSVKEVDIDVKKTRTTPENEETLDCSEKEIVWQIAVTNNSEVALTNVQVVDTPDPWLVDNGNFTPAADQNDKTIKFTIPELAAKTTETLTLSYTLTKAETLCDWNLQNNVKVNWGCKLPTEPPSQCDNETQEFTDTHLSTRTPNLAALVADVVASSIDSCTGNKEIAIKITNNDPDAVAPLVSIEIELPDNLYYVAGSQGFGIGKNSDFTTIPTSAANIQEVTQDGNKVIFTLKTPPQPTLGLSTSNTNTGKLIFRVAAHCFDGGTIKGTIDFLDCCGDSHQSKPFRQTLTPDKPVLDITKTLVSYTPKEKGCGGLVKYKIDVENTSTEFPAERIRVEDRPGSWLEVILNSNNPAWEEDATNPADVFYRQIQDDKLSPQGNGTNTASFTLDAKLLPVEPAQEDCPVAPRINKAKVFWGCDANAQFPETNHICWSETDPVKTQAKPVDMPDLVVSKISADNSCADPDSPKSKIEITVKNNKPAGKIQFPFKVKIDIFKGDEASAEHTHTVTVADEAGMSIVYAPEDWAPDCASCKHPNCNSCKYHVKVTVDSDNDVCECDETNNNGSTDLPPIPKLEIVDDPVAEPRCAGKSVVKVKVKNVGCGDAKAFAVKFTINGKSRKEDVAALAAGAEKELEFSMPDDFTAVGGPYSYTVTVDPDNAVCECNADEHEKEGKIFIPDCAIDLEKATNAENPQTPTDAEDADDPTGPFIASGNTVTWTYLVSNPGNVTMQLTTEPVSDDPIGPVTACEDPQPPPQPPQTQPDNSLLPGQTMICTATGTATTGQYKNTGSVVGTPVDDNGNRIGDDIPADDSSHYFGARPSITIEKATNAKNPQAPTNAEDADDPTGPFIMAGDPVVWTYLIKNTGNVALHNVEVSDEPVGSVTDCDPPQPPQTQPANSLLPGQTMLCRLTGTATTIGQYQNLGKVTGDAVDPDGNPILDSEGKPITKTADDPSHYFGAKPSIDIEKDTNGVDADDPLGEYIASGDAITWTYVVKNTGNVKLSPVTVSDDQGVAVSCPRNYLTAKGTAESTMTCTATGISDTIFYGNIGGVSGQPVDDNDKPIEDENGKPVDPVTDKDPSHYYSAAPKIDIEKATNGEDADTAAEAVYIIEGGNVVWSYVVTNPGNIRVNDIIATDNKEGAITCPKNWLAVGESMTCTSKTGIAVLGAYDNIAEVTGNGADDNGDTILDANGDPRFPVDDSDPSHYLGVNPSVDVEKETNGVQSDDPPGEYIASGKPVTWTYLVENTGDITLDNIVVTDNQGVAVDCPEGITSLAPGEMMTCSGIGTADTLFYENIANVSGRPVDNNGDPVHDENGNPVDPVTDEDPSHYYSAKPSFSIEKATNGVDADTPPGTEIMVGEPVTWTYTVTNTGKIELNNIVVTDNRGVAVSCPGTSLAPGQRMVCTARGIAEEGQYSNIGRVTGQPPGGPKTTAEDPSHYHGVLPAALRAFPPERDNYQDCCLTADKELTGRERPLDAVSANRDLYYHTHRAMYLAYELGGLVNIDDGIFYNQYKRSTQRDNVLARAENSSARNIAVLSMRSGLGHGLELALDGASAEARRKALENRLAGLAQQTGWQGDVAGLKPLVVEYYGAVPKEGEDGLWHTDSVDTALSPYSWGMTLLAEAQELERLWSEDSAESRFVASVLLWQIEIRMALLKSYLAAQPEDNRYLAHRLKLDDNGGLALSGVDGDFYLVDQAAMVLGLSRLEQALSVRSLSLAKSVAGLRETLWKSMEQRVDSETGVWKAMVAVSDGDEKTNSDSYDVLELLVAVQAADMAGKVDDSLFGSESYASRVKKTVAYLKGLVDANGMLAARIQDGQPADDASFFATVALARMELLAGDNEAALQRYRQAEKRFWDNKYQLYRPYAVNDAAAEYEPVAMAAFAGFLNQATAAGLRLEPELVDRGLSFVDRILFQAGLQIDTIENLLPESKPIVAGNRHDVVPLVAEKDQLAIGRLAPVALRRISVNLPYGLKDQGTGRDIESESSAAGSVGADQVLYQQKSRTIDTGDVSLAMSYLDDAVMTSARFAAMDDPYLGGGVGLDTFARSAARIWRSNLFAISYWYGRGVSINDDQAGTDQKRLEQLYRPWMSGGAAEQNADFMPLFIEYEQGEPFKPGTATGWAGSIEDNLVSVATIVQLERSRIRFLADVTAAAQSQQAAGIAGYASELKRIVEAQLAAKWHFIDKFVGKTIDSEGFLPGELSVVRDSRNMVIDYTAGTDNIDQTGLLSLALYLSDLDQVAQQGDLPVLRDGAARRQVLFARAVELCVAADNEAVAQGTKRPVLEKSLVLDLFGQLYNSPLLTDAGKKAVASIIKAKTDGIVSVLKADKPFDRVGLLGSLAQGKDEIAAYAGLLRALERVDSLDLGTTLKPLIHDLAVGFNDRFWNEKLGVYHGTATVVDNRSFKRKSYHYSELDVSLVLSSLVGALDYLDGAERSEIAGRVLSFEERTLVSKEETTRVLNDLVVTKRDFDMEILQDMDIVSTSSQVLFAGDVVEYRIHLYNRCKPEQNNPPLHDVKVKDTLPEGVRYLPGSSRIDGRGVADPAISHGNLTWTVDRLDDHVIIRFKCLVAEDFDQGELHNSLDTWVDLGDERNRFCSFSAERDDKISRPESSLDVVYYSDLNFNQKRDPEEPLLQGIDTLVNGEKDMSLQKIKGGWYYIQPDWASVQGAVYPSAKTPVSVAVRDGQDKDVAIGLVEYGSVQGWIFEDLNGNGQMDNGEKGLSHVRLQIADRPEAYCYSGQDGFFRIDRLVGGEQTYKVELSSKQPYAEVDPTTIQSVGIVWD